MSKNLCILHSSGFHSKTLRSRLDKWQGNIRFVEHNLNLVESLSSQVELERDEGLLYLGTEEILEDFPAILDSLQKEMSFLGVSDLERSEFMELGDSSWHLSYKWCGVFFIDSANWQQRNLGEKMLKELLLSDELDLLPLFMENEGEQKALFLDRDGILIDDISYISRPEDVSIQRDILSLLKGASSLGYKLVILTNQSGLAREKFTLQDYERVTDEMIRQFKSEGVEFSKIYFSPFMKGGSHPEYGKDSICRKPAPGMLWKACRELGLSPAKSWMIGDKDSDCLHTYGPKYIVLRDRYPISGENAYRVYDDLKSLSEGVLQEMEKEGI